MKLVHFSMQCVFTCFCKVRFIADLVNCRVLMPSALLEFFNMLLAATMEDHIPQVLRNYNYYITSTEHLIVLLNYFEKFSLNFSKLLE